jgi:hypothetical protein
MKKIALLLSSAVIAFSAAGQDGITFRVEKLSKPEKPLYDTPSTGLYERLIRQDAGLDSPAYDIICHSAMPDRLVTYGYHSFFDGMYRAYSDHRPFVLSPDMIWLLISQGFARHVNANPESMRDCFVDFAGKMSLIVDEIPLDASAEEWETAFPQFVEQMSENTKGDIINILSADFSTTGPVEKVASQITVMDAMEPYYEFIVMMAGCGIPEITLKGTPEDWQKVLDKTKLLARYDLEWWTSELVPLLEQFVRASKGKIKKSFWREMFKYHNPKPEKGKIMLYPPDIIDGWIVKFFPYDRDGKRNDLISVNKKSMGGHNLPDEIVKVDLTHITVNENNGDNIAVPLELWAGFIGLEQNEQTCALTPRIGWMIRIKDVDNTARQQKFEAENNSGGIKIRVREVPSALLKLKHIKRLQIEFTDKIVIPDKMRDVRIDMMSLKGEISTREIERIKSMFPDTSISINGDVINGKGFSNVSIIRIGPASEQEEPVTPRVDGGFAHERADDFF